MKTMKRGLVALALLMLVAPVAQARMNAQGVLRQADGALIDGELAVTFGIYETPQGQGLLWSETQTVTVVSGVFDSLLPVNPEANPWPPGLFWGDEPRWLEIQPEGQAPLARTLIAAVPRAMSSLRAAVAAESLALGCTGCITSGHLAAEVLDQFTPAYDDALANLGVDSMQGAIDALSAGLDDHALNPDAHHPANSAGIHIEPQSVKVGETSLTDGTLDLGPEAEDQLDAAQVKTLTAGGDADALHTHAGAGGGGGGVCYTSWGTPECGTGFSTMYTGQAYTAIAIAPSNSTYYGENMGSTQCVADAALNPSPLGAATYHRAIAYGHALTHLNAIPCALCCK